MKQLKHLGRMMRLTAVVTVCLMVLPGCLGAQAEKPMPAAEPNAMPQSAAASIKAEIDRLQALEDQLRQLESRQKGFEAEINAYRVQASAQASTLLLPQSDIQVLEKAWGEIRATLDILTTRLKEHRQKLDTLARLQLQTEEQFQLNAKQLDELQTADVSGSDAQGLRQSLKELGQLLPTRGQTLTRLHQRYAQRTQTLTEIHQNFSELEVKFEEYIKAQKRQVLFKRQSSPLSLLSWDKLQGDFVQIGRQIRQLLTRSYWVTALGYAWRTNAFMHITSALLIGLALLALKRLKSLLKRLTHQPFYLTYYWRRMAINLLQKSARLLGIIVVMQILISLRPAYAAFPFVTYLTYALTSILFTRWGLRFITYWQQEDRPPLEANTQHRLCFLLYTLRYFTIAYLVVAWLTGQTSMVLMVARLGFETFLFIWNFHFWNAFDWTAQRSDRVAHRQAGVGWSGLRTLAYGTVLAGPIMDLMGYGSLALYWYTSWAYTTVVYFWGTLAFFLLREWNQAILQKPGTGTDGMIQNAHPVQWLLIRFGWVVWFVMLLVGTLLSWGSKRELLIALFEILNHPVTVGKIQFSLMNFVYALLILLATRLVTSVWRYLLNKKILEDSGFETGLKDSITMITVYSLWAFGILIAMQAFGLSATSLAVAFGALGIGLGFGLQNIFNNFISGLILLFERPIQVGDEVEINGTLATVKRINVRATVVQTFDNASLIIPNSEFISSQVINWSFKDKSLRRKINVGVAYGSDIELVRQTLLEIADKTPKVYKKPKPDVIFKDFGDSALNFELRVWTDIDNMLKVPTAIRFEIDRLFKVRGIVIAFPQRDVHLFVEEKEALNKIANSEVSKKDASF